MTTDSMERRAQHLRACSKHRFQNALPVRLRFLARLPVTRSYVLTFSLLRFLFPSTARSVTISFFFFFLFSLLAAIDETLSSSHTTRSSPTETYATTSTNSSKLSISVILEELFIEM